MRAPDQEISREIHLKLSCYKLSSISAHRQLCITWNESDLHFFQEVISHRKTTGILPLSVGSITECLLFGDSMTGTARKGKVNRSMVSVLVQALSEKATLWCCK